MNASTTIGSLATTSLHAARRAAPAVSRPARWPRLAAVLTLSVLAAGVAAYGAEYFVDNSCPTAGDGTTTTCGAQGPFKSIAAALSNTKLAAGDVIRIRATGTDYVEGTVNTSKAGAAGNPITVTRYAGETGKPVWKRTSGSTMLVVDEPYYTFEGISFVATAESADIVHVLASNVTFRNCDFREGGYAINISDAGDDLTVDGCTFDGNGNNEKHSITTGRLGVTAGYTLTGLVITNSRFTNGDQDYIQTFEDSGKCRQDTVTGRIEGNTFLYGPGQAENAIDIKTTALASDPLKIVRNEIRGWGGSSNNGRPVVLQHCADYVLFHDNLVDAGTDGPCDPCICLAVSASTAGGKAPQTGVEIVGNTFVNCKYAILFGDSDTTAGDVGNVKIHNNTAAKLRSGEFIQVKTDIVSGTVRNNLWDGSGSTATALDCVGGAHDITGLVADHNGWFGSSSQQSSCAMDCTGDICDATDTKGPDPAFVDWSGNDFRLRSESPAIDKGIPVGRAYSGAAPDLGAYETGGTPPPDTDPPASVINLRRVDRRS